jgi:hypothetical protein
MTHKSDRLLGPLYLLLSWLISAQNTLKPYLKTNDPILGIVSSGKHIAVAISS